MQALMICDDCDVTATATLCKQRGYGIEVQSFFDPSYLEAQPQAVECHKLALAGIGLCSLHGPFGDLTAGSFDSMVREVARVRFEQAVEIAGKLEIKQVVLHHGYVPGTSPLKQWIVRLADFWHQFLQDKPSDLLFHLENVLEREPELLRDVIYAINDPRVDLCLDIGHVYCHSDRSLVDWISCLGEQIGYVHLHDNHGESDEHLGLGKGTIPLKVVCAKLEEKAPKSIWALESKPADVVSSLDWLQHERFI